MGGPQGDPEDRAEWSARCALEPEHEEALRGSQGRFPHRAKLSATHLAGAHFSFRLWLMKAFVCRSEVLEKSA